MKIVKALVFILILTAPIALVVAAYLYISTQVAVMIAFLAVPLIALAVGTLIKNKMEYGQFLFIKEKKKTTEALNSGFECPYCGARFSFKRISCPDCGKSLNK